MTPGSRRFPQSSGSSGKRDRCNSRQVSVSGTGVVSNLTKSGPDPLAEPGQLGEETRRINLRPESPAAIRRQYDHSRERKGVTPAFDPRGTASKRGAIAGLPNRGLAGVVGEAERVGEKSRPWQPLHGKVVGLPGPFL